MKLELADVKMPLAEFTLAVDLNVEARVLGLCGPSGAGKTSLLDLIGGLRRPLSARVVLDGRVLTDTSKQIYVAARSRRVGYVPQDLALFPHLSVRRNLLYGKNAEAESAESIFSFDHVVQVLEIAPFVERTIHELSGGERQRVALGRALLSSPRLLLLDEPLASLDLDLKERILRHLIRVREEFPVPMIYVSHSPGELKTLCDTVIKLDRGRLVDVSKV